MRIPVSDPFRFDHEVAAFMFELVVMPLIELWMDEGLDEEAVQATLSSLQEVLSAETSQEIAWTETLEELEFEADGVAPYCLYGLRAVAAHLEDATDLEGFELTDEPWLHDAFAALESNGHAQRFPQILHADGSPYVAYIPADLPELYLMQDEDEPDAVDFSIGSLVRLRAELDSLREALGLEPGLEDHIDDIVFDPAEDKLAGPRYGWLVMSARCNEALEKKLPLILIDPFEDDLDDEDDDDLDGGAGDTSGDGNSAPPLLD